MLTRLLTGVGPQCLRNYFLTIHPTWSNQPSDANALKKGPLKLQKCEEAKYNTGNIEDWDVSLLVRVLRFSALSSSKLKLNPDIDDALCRIRDIRNEIIAHATSEKISDIDFKILWKDLKCNLLMIGGSEEDIDETLIEDTELVAEQYKDLLLEEKSLRRYEIENIGSQNNIRNVNEETPLQNQSTVQWDDWIKFLACMNSFNSAQTHFVLVADEMTQINLHNFKVLSAIPWIMVIDFNPSSEDNGLYKAFSNQSNLQRILSPFTPGEIKKVGYEGLPKQIDSKRTQWLFANGRKEDTDDSKPKSFPIWRKLSKKYISLLFSCCSQGNKFDNQKSIICLLLPISKSTEAFMEETLNLFSEHFSDFNLTFVSIDGSYKKLDISPGIHLFPLSPEELKNGLDNLFKDRENSEGFEVPANIAELPIRLSTREYNYMEELLELFYIGCQNEFINLEDEEEDRKANEEEEHRISFLSGNLISFLSLYFNHDAKREVEKDIEIHIVRLLNQGLKHSVIVQIAHPPGTGGSTIARRVLWNIHEHFPCASVRLPNQTEFDEDSNFIDELCNRILFLEDKCNNPPVILLDGHRHWRVHALSNRIVRTLNSRGKHAVVLECIRSAKRESKPFGHPNTDIHRVFVVNARLEDSPADLKEFKDKFQESNSSARRVFHFPLLSMIEEFRAKLTTIVSNSLHELNNVEYEIAAFVAFLQLYGELSTPSRLLYQAFQSHLSISVCEQVTYESVRDCFTDSLLNLMVFQRRTKSNLRKSKDNGGCFSSYTLQHHVVAELVFKMYLNDKNMNLYQFVFGFLEYNISIEEFLDLYCDIFLFNKVGNRDLKFSLLIEKLGSDNPEGAAIIFDKAAKKIPDPRVYGHAARFYAKMKPPRFEEAEALIEAGVKQSESKGRVKSIQDGKGVVLALELRHKIRHNQVESIEQLEELAQKAIVAFKAARDFPPTFHSPLLGEVEVWLSCIEWITTSLFSGDVAEAVRFITTHSPSFFRTCIGDCFTLLDIVDDILGVSTTVSDPDKIELRSKQVRVNLMKATTFKRRLPTGKRGGDAYDPLFGLNSEKNLPVFTNKQSKRAKARLWLSSFYRDPSSFHSKQKEDLVKFLEEMVVIEKEFSFARHFFQLCTQIVGPRNYTLDQCWKVCHEWLQQPEIFDPMRYYYRMVIAFIHVLNGHEPFGYFAEFKSMVQKLKEESRNNCRRNHSFHYLQKDGDGMSQLISHQDLTNGNSTNKADNSDSEAVHNFWKVESRRKLKECTGRLRVKFRGNKKVTTIELVEGGIELYVGKSAETGTPGRDFDKDTKVYFVVSFTLNGPNANGITFQPMKPTHE